MQAFVACGWGISRIGYVMIWFGIANALAAGLSGAVAKMVGRNNILICTLILHGSLLMWMRQWIAVPNDFIAYCSMAALWGLLDGTWLVIINCKSLIASIETRFDQNEIFFCLAYYGILFRGKEEAAFSNFRLFESCGSVIAYSLSPILCAATKINSIFVLMIVGIIGYVKSQSIMYDILQQNLKKKCFCSYMIVEYLEHKDKSKSNDADRTQYKQASDDTRF